MIPVMPIPEPLRGIPDDILRAGGFSAGENEQLLKTRCPDCGALIFRRERCALCDHRRDDPSSNRLN